MTVLELKEKLVRFYGKNELYIMPVIRFAVAFVTFLTINHNIGYMEKISKTPIALILALFCSVLPANGTILLASFVILADLYALSLEVCLVALLLFIVIYLVYFRFAPRHGYDVLFAPLCFRFHIPYIVPVGMGLLREVHSIFSFLCGTILYFFLHGVKENAPALGAAAEADATTSKIVVALNQLLGNKEMFLTAGVMMITLIIVYIIRRMSIENAWTVAIISGILFETVGLITGYLMLGIKGKTVEVLIGNLISAVVAMGIQFLCFNLDYSRTERLQFEDDEYYYYVKAVPKAFVSGTDKKIKRFGGKDEKEERLTKKQFARELDIDEDLLD